MRPKYTQEKAIELMLETHGNTYDYSKTIYVHSEIKFEVICKVHGSFWVKPKEHRQGAGCFKCAHDLCGLSHRLDANDVLQKLKEVHGESLSFDLVEFAGTNKKVKVICNHHNKVFERVVSDLLVGKGCQRCALDRRNAGKRSNTQDFVEKALKLFSGLYAYTNTTYIDNRTKVSITCQTHGDFLMQPSNHLMGKGCPKCMKCGYNVGKQGTFYILQCGDITKVGITNRKVGIRLEEICKHSRQNFKIHTTFFSEDGSVPYGIEQQVLKYLSSKYKPVEEVFDGSTECFLDVDINDLLSFVAPLSNKTTESQSDLN